MFFARSASESTWSDPRAVGRRGERRYNDCINADSFWDPTNTLQTRLEPTRSRDFRCAAWDSITLDVNVALRSRCGDRRRSLGDALAKRIAPIHPGEVLLEEFLKPMGISQYRLAKDITVPARRINEIVHGNRSITADTALRLSRYFGMTEQFWMNLQSHYELEVEKESAWLATRCRGSAVLRRWLREFPPNLTTYTTMRIPRR